MNKNSNLLFGTTLTILGQILFLQEHFGGLFKWK